MCPRPHIVLHLDDRTYGGGGERRSLESHLAYGSTLIDTDPKRLHHVYTKSRKQKAQPCRLG
ncbi:protein of unknown function [Paraburkholderia kururiensis]